MKLTRKDSDKIRHLFEKSKGIYTYTPEQFFIEEYIKKDFVNFEHEIFCENYLGQLKNWHSFTNEKFSSAVVCYQSEDEASWYLTDIYGEEDLDSLLLEVINFNQNLNLFKFYVVLPMDVADSFNLATPEYDYFDEMFIQEKTKCYFSSIWQLLYKRTLPNKNTVVRCYFLKKEYRNKIPFMGNI